MLEGAVADETEETMTEAIEEATAGKVVTETAEEVAIEEVVEEGTETVTTTVVVTAEEGDAIETSNQPSSYQRAPTLVSFRANMIPNRRQEACGETI